MLDAVVRRPVLAAIAGPGPGRPSACRSRSSLGGEFMPRLNEGDLLIEAVRIPSASLEGAVPASTQIEDILKKFPEVRMVYCKTGRPEIANDVMGVHQTDVWTMLKPQAEWRPGPDPRPAHRGDGQGPHRERPGREVRLQPADRDAGQRAGGGRQERRRRPDLRARPRRPPAEGGARSRRSSPGSPAPRTSRRRPRAGCRCSASRSAATSSPATGSRPTTSSTPSPRWAGRPSARSFEGQKRFAHPGPPAGVVAERPRADRLDPDHRPQGPADPPARPGRRRLRGRPQRDRARERPAPGGRRRERPGPRHRRLRRRGPGRDRRRRSSSPPAT